MEIALVLLIIAAAVYLFVTEKYPGALISMMVVAVLILVSLLTPWVPWIHQNRWITPSEGVTGFSNPATITVAAMFVLSAGLQSTGAIAWMGRLFDRLAGRPVMLITALLVVTSVVSAFVNNTATVAIFIPVTLAACQRQGVPPSKFLIPLSYASQFGGVCTLIGSSTNLVVSSISQRSGYPPLGMFELTSMGLLLTVAGLAYLLLVGRRLLPDREGRGLVQTYQVAEYVTELLVPPSSPLVGKTLREVGFGTETVHILAVMRSQQALWPVIDTSLASGDLLLVRAPAAQIMSLRHAWKLELYPEFRFTDETLRRQNLQLAEVVVAPRSWLEGRTIREAEFRRRYGCTVLGIQSREAVPLERISTIRLNLGDALLVLGTPDDIARLRRHPEFLLLDRVDEPALRRAKIPLALGIFGAVVALATFNVLPIMASALFGCIALVATRCLSMEEACEAIDWQVIFLLAGMLPLGLAMEKSGAAHLIAGGAVTLARPFGPLAALAVVYLLTAVLTEFMSHNATAVLLTPIALAVGVALKASPRPFLVAVCLAASTTFCTPVGYQTNAMVQHAGGYRFTDYLKVGLPLNLLFWLLSVIFIPHFWPF